VLFLLAFFGHAAPGAHEFSAEQAAHGQPGMGVWQFMPTSEFWFQSFQN
jgi:Domain of unknown function (DUF6766)